MVNGLSDVYKKHAIELCFIRQLLYALRNLEPASLLHTEYCNSSSGSNDMLLCAPA
jgi:hypothetical protein